MNKFSYRVVVLRHNVCDVGPPQSVLDGHVGRRRGGRHAALDGGGRRGGRRRCHVAEDGRSEASPCRHHFHLLLLSVPFSAPHAQSEQRQADDQHGGHGRTDRHTKHLDAPERHIRKNDLTFEEIKV